MKLLLLDFRNFRINKFNKTHNYLSIIPITHKKTTLSNGFAINYLNVLFSPVDF